MSWRYFLAIKIVWQGARSLKCELPDLDFTSFIDRAYDLFIVWSAVLDIANRHNALSRLVRMPLLPLWIMINEPSE